MQTLSLTAPRKLVWQLAPRPVLPSGAAALVRPIAVATCDFDHLLVSGAMPAPLPLSIGHECVAQVLEVGDQVQRIRVGDRVVVPFQVSCGSCAACRRGQTSACGGVPWLSCYGLGAMAGNWGGAFTDVVSIPYADAMLVPLPSDVEPAEAAAVSCNLVDAYRAVAPGLEQHPGARVLVASGAFANIALYAVVLARALGAGEVAFFDRSPQVAERASRLGARVLPSLEALCAGDFLVTVEASMDAEIMAETVRATAPGGRCTLTTMFPDPATSIPLMAAFERCLTLVTGQPHARQNMEPVLQLMRSQRLDLSGVVDAVVDWSSAPEVLASGSGKYVCTRPEL
jgi:threonine dehydrogenase-like Zn-dependent dehydrogenase